MCAKIITGGSNPFKKQGTQYAKDQKVIKALSKNINKGGKVSNKTKPSYAKIAFRSNETFNKSIAESRIYDWLKKHNVKFEPEKTFSQCRSSITGNPLRFDFYLPLHNICIEYDGYQHFHNVKEWEINNPERLSKLKTHDLNKTNFCLKKKINLIRITYKQFNEIERILFRSILNNQQ